MKSNRAKLAINSQATFETVRGYAVEYPVVVQAICQAEEDAFERAKDAVRKGCIHYRENRACGIGIYCVKDIDCFQLNNFINHYDKAK